MTRNNKRLTRLGMGAVAITGVLASLGAAGTGASAAATAAPVTKSSTVAYDCRTTVQQGFHPVAYSRGFDVTAPASVTVGSEFDVTFDPAPITAYAEYNKTVTDVQVAYQIPKNAKVKSYTLTGGSGLGRSFSWVEKRDGSLVVRTSGPFTGGVEFDLPTLAVHFKADKSVGTVSFVSGGKSYEEPGFSWFRHQPILDEWGPFQCFPDAAQPVVELAAVQITK
jgi:dehydratase